MSDNHDAAELEALAANPRTDWDVLHWIAENHPTLRPTIAANPGTYQELVDALGTLGDPDIDYAIALRHRGRDVSSATAATNPLAGMYDTATHTIPAYQPQPGDAEPYYTNLDYDQQTPADAPEADADPAISPEADLDTGPDTDPVPYVPSPAAEEPPRADEPPSPETSAPQPVAGAPAPEPLAPEPPEPAPYPGPAEPSDPQPPVPATAPAAAAPLAAPAAHPRPEHEDSERRRAPLGLIAAAILGVVAVGAVIAALITFLGGDEETPVAEPPAGPTEEAPAEEEDEEESEPTEEAEETEPAEPDPEQNLEEVRAEVASLPEESACQADEDSGVVAAFVAAGTDTDDFPGGEDADLLEETFSQLQSECSSTHAASVFTAARSGTAYPDEAPEGAQAAMDSVGTEWVDRAAGLRGAETMSGFTAQGGNVECEFDDGVVCTVYNTNPQQCDTGATYRMTLDGVELDCDAELDAEDRDTLSVDDSATDGFLVCTEMSDRVSCYNTVELFGFEMSSTGNYPY